MPSLKHKKKFVIALFLVTLILLLMYSKQQGKKYEEFTSKVNEIGGQIIVANGGANKVPLISFLFKKDIALILDASKAKDLSFLSDYSNITSLELRGKSEILDYAFLSNLKKLQLLKIEDFKDGVVLPISGFEALEKLDLSDSNCTDFAFLKNCLKLKSLDLSNTHFADLNKIAALELKFLNISFTKVKELSIILQLKSLENVNLRGLDYDKSFIDQLFSELPNFTGGAL